MVEVIAFTALATDAVVATHHVVERGFFLVASSFLGAGTTRVLRIVAQAVRPAVVLEEAGRFVSESGRWGADTRRDTDR